MEHCIENGILRITAREHGAELQSIWHLGHGFEALWQGDPAIWADRSPNLFPYIARLTGGRYTYRGRTYEMRIHGIAMYSDFQLIEHGGDSMCFELTDSDATYAQYPFRFRFRVRYALSGDTLTTTYEVENADDKPMHFGVGGHPGINVPLGGDGRFEDWRIRFIEPCSPVRMGTDAAMLLTGDDRPFALVDGRELPLRHSLFDDDAIVLKGVAPALELINPASAHSVRLDYEGLPCLGMWHMPKTQAGYVCLEPWSSLFSRAGITENLETQPDLLCAAPGETVIRKWSLRVR